MNDLEKFRQSFFGTDAPRQPYTNTSPGLSNWLAEQAMSKFGSAVGPTPKPPVEPTPKPPVNTPYNAMEEYKRKQKLGETGEGRRQLGREMKPGPMQYPGGPFAPPPPAPIRETPDGMKMWHAKELYGDGYGARTDATQAAQAAQVAPTAQAAQVPPTANAAQAFPVDGSVTGQNPNSQPSAFQKFMQGLAGPMNTLGKNLVAGPTVGPGGEYRNALSNTAIELGEKADKEATRKRIADSLIKAGMSPDKAFAAVESAEGIKAAQEQVLAPTTFKPNKAQEKSMDEWRIGKPAFASNMNTLRKSLKYLENDDSMFADTGFLSQLAREAPEMAKRFFDSGQENISNAALVQGIAAENLKLILGGQFAQKEGEQLLARAYDHRLTHAQNHKRVTSLIQKMEGMAAVKDALLKDPNMTPEEINDRLWEIYEDSIEEIDPGGGKAKGASAANGVSVISVRKTPTNQ